MIKINSIIYCLFVIVVITSCTNAIEKPNNSIAFTSNQIVNLAKQVERAQAIGNLSEKKGDEYLDLLIQANDLLKSTSNNFNNLELCEDLKSKLECVDNILFNVEKGL